VSHQRINPEGIFDSKPFGFSQVVISEPGRKTVHCSGQTAWDQNLEVIGKGDIAIQTQEALRNVGLALAAAGATPADVVRLHVYIVNHSPDLLPMIGAAMTAFFGEDTLPASTLLGVQSLAIPEFLIEIEVTAVV
jgi:enamine deaminase RidA (YjgF/YER057c/UK114 family)